MKKDSLNTGRANQKRKTRNQILDTAQQFLKSGAEFTLEDVAKNTGLSRATVYRYFSSANLLCAEAALNVETKSTESLVEEMQNLSLSETLFHLQQYFNELSQRHETAFRKYLSVVLDESVKTGRHKHLRGARRPYSVDVIMEYYRKKMKPNDLRNLKHIITVLSGIEPLIANKDVNGLTNQESNELLQWALEMILKGVEADDL